MKPVPSVPRWTDGDAEPEQLRAALLTLSDEGPSDAQLDRLIGAVSARVVVQPAQPGVEPPRARGQRSALRLVWPLAGAALLWWSLSRSEEPEPRLPVEEKAPVVTAPTFVPVPDPEPTPEPAPEPTPKPRRAVQRPKPLLDVEPQPPPAPLVTPVRPRLADEIALLRRAKRAMPIEPGAALEILRIHEHDFATGAFREERDALEVEALHGLGRTNEATQKRTAFRARYPGSAYTRRIDALFE